MISADNQDDLPPSIRRRLGLPVLSSRADDLRQAAWQREVDFANAVLRASAGGETDSDELLDLGAKCGLTPCQTFIALRAAEDAHRAWRMSVHRTIFPLT